MVLNREIGAVWECLGFAVRFFSAFGCHFFLVDFESRDWGSLGMSWVCGTAMQNLRAILDWFWAYQIRGIGAVRTGRDPFHRAKTDRSGLIVFQIRNHPPSQYRFHFQNSAEISCIWQIFPQTFKTGGIIREYLFPVQLQSSCDCSLRLGSVFFSSLFPFFSKTFCSVLERLGFGIGRDAGFGRPLGLDLGSGRGTFSCHFYRDFPTG